jgi:superfamily II DNA helicase RecQ
MMSQRQSFAGSVRVLCSTIAFGLGMDLPNIGLIIHWDAATSLLDYVQQTDRGGRDGSPCLCITLYDRYENQTRLRLMRKTSNEHKRKYTLGNMLQVCSARFPFWVLCVSMHVRNVVQYTQLVAVMQLMTWYETANLCRLRFIEQHFCVSSDAPAAPVACRTLCDFCQPQEDVCAIVKSFEKILR